MLVRHGHAYSLKINMKEVNYDLLVLWNALVKRSITSSGKTNSSCLSLFLLCGSLSSSVSIKAFRYSHFEACSRRQGQINEEVTSSAALPKLVNT